MKVTIGIPNRDDFKSEMVASLMRIVTQTGCLVNLAMPTGCYIDELRNTCWDSAKESGSDWLLFMDSDNSVDFSGNAFKTMIDFGQDVVSGIYVQKGYPYRPLVYRFTEEGLIQNWKEIPSYPFTADATGCGLLLISKKVMDAFTPEVEKELGRPFNFLNYGKPNMLREDPAFCWRIQKLGFKLWFLPEITMSHYGKQRYNLDHFEKAKANVIESQKAVDLGIDGWMEQRELQFLRKQANNMDTVVEIGCWKGRSTKALLESEAVVYAVDHWKGSDDIRELAESENIEAEFDKNVGMFENLKKVKMSSLEAAKKFNGNGGGFPNQVDMVFIDASHEYKDIKSDIEAWLPKAKKVICGHDYSLKWPGVIKAVNEKFKDKIELCDSIWYVNLEGK